MHRSVYMRSHMKYDTQKKGEKKKRKRRKSSKDKQPGACINF